MFFQWVLETVFGTCIRRSLAKCEGCGIGTRNGKYCTLCSEEGFVDEHRLYGP